MDRITFKKFLDWLCLRFDVFARKRQGKQVQYTKVADPEEIELEEKALFPLRKLFFPPREKIYTWQHNQFKPEKPGSKKMVIFGIPLYDLEALTQFSVIFGKDPYFQSRIRNTLIIGLSPVPDEHTFFRAFEENILRHRKFDLYFDYNYENETYRLFTGSEDGQKIFENFGASHYEHIEYQGAVPRKGITPYWQKIKEKIKKSQRNKFWTDLGKTCLGCGKCTLACPTCYCYDLIMNSQSQMRREWGSCFYPEFSEVAGGHTFLKNRTARIYNWYDHKFVRMPEEYGFVGCVQCGRCTAVCPVKIDIEKNLKKIEKF